MVTFTKEILNGKLLFLFSVSKQNGSISINKKEKAYVLMKNHVLLEVLTIFSKVSACDYNAKIVGKLLNVGSQVLGFTGTLMKEC